MNINTDIRNKEVFVIDDTGTTLGKMATSTAINLARDKDLDLVEVSPNSNPPVCKFMDYGKHLYDQKKGRKENRQQKVLTKEIRLRPNIEENDLCTKAKQATKFIKDGNKVLIKVVLRGRENVHPDLGFKLIDKFCAIIDYEFKTDKPSKHEGKNIARTICP